MSSSFTHTESQTFTRTHAKYIASKIAADLRQMQLFYGEPSDQQINDYVDEVVELLVNDYLDSVDYGFRKDNKWVLALSYSVKSGNLLQTDDRSGRVSSSVDKTGCYWGSYLRKSQKFFDLPSDEQRKIENNLPIKRTTGDEPGTSNGMWTWDKTYSKNGVAVERKTFKPW